MQEWGHAVQLSSFIPVEEDLIMVPNLWFFQLLVVTLALICLLIHVWWPDTPLPLPQPPRKSTKRRHTRAQEPQPFPGLIRKPLCESCAQGTEACLKAPGSPV